MRDSETPLHVSISTSWPTYMGLNKLPNLNLSYFLVRCSKASDPRRGHVSIIDMLNSLNINFTGIHALENLSSVKFYEK